MCFLCGLGQPGQQKKKNIHSLWEWWSDRGRMASALTHRWRWAGEDRNAAGDTERDWRSLHGAADKTSPARADGSAHDSNDRRLKMITAAPTARFYPASCGAGRKQETHANAGLWERFSCGKWYFPPACWRDSRWTSDTLGLKPRWRHGPVGLAVLGAAHRGSGSELISIQHA